MLYFGLDGEMTGADLDRGCRLIQIGVAVAVDEDGTPRDASDVTDGPSCRLDVYESLVGWRSDDEVTYQDAGMAVHGVTIDQIMAATHRDQVDTDLTRWLEARGATERPRRVRPIGFNVNGFDLPFLADALPNANARFSRRPVELNSATATLAGVVQLSGSPATEKGLKRAAKRWAASELDGHPQLAAGWHSAGYDAAAAVLVWRWLRWAASGRPVPN